MRRDSKGQASLEYLTTYAWALFIIFLVIGVVSSYIVFKSTSVPLECFFGDHFVCSEIVYNESGGAIMLILKNVESSVVVDGIDVVVKDGSCSPGSPPVLLSNIWFNDTIPVGQASDVGYAWPSSQRKAVSISCPGQGRFILDVSIKYIEESGKYLKSSTGTIRGER